MLSFVSSSVSLFDAWSLRISRLALSPVFSVSIPFLFSYSQPYLQMILTVSGCPSLLRFCFFLGLCVFPGLWSQSPCSGLSVSWLREGGQSFQHKHQLCPNETLWLWPAENKPPYEFWTSLASKSCLWTTDTLRSFYLLAAAAKPAAPYNMGQIRQNPEALWLVKKTMWDLLWISIGMICPYVGTH